MPTRPAVLTTQNYCPTLERLIGGDRAVWRGAPDLAEASHSPQSNFLVRRASKGVVGATASDGAADGLQKAGLPVRWFSNRPDHEPWAHCQAGNGPES